MFSSVSAVALTLLGASIMLQVQRQKAFSIRENVPMVSAIYCTTECEPKTNIILCLLQAMTPEEKKNIDQALPNYALW